MVDVNKKVGIDFSVDTDSLERKMKKMSNFQKEVGHHNKKLRQDSLKGYRQLNKVTEPLRAWESSRGDSKSLRKHHALNNAYKKTSDVFKAKAAASSEVLKNLNAEHTMIRKVAREHAKYDRSRGWRPGGGGRGGGGRGGGGRGGGGGGRDGGGIAPGGFMKKAAGALKSAMGALADLGGGAIAGAIGIMASQVQAAYSARIQYGQAYGKLAGLGGRKSSVDALRGRGVSLGYAPTEVASMARPVARQTGMVGGPALRTAMEFNRATGMDIGETSGLMGVLRRGGQKFGRGGGGRNEMVKMLSMGVQSGLERSRMPEFFSGVTKIMQRQQGVAAGDVSAMPAANLLALMQTSGLSGLQGARGSNVLQQLDSAMRSPGGGEAGEALLMRAYGFGKPGGKASYFEAFQRKEQGLYGKGNFHDLFTQVRSEASSMEEALLVMNKITKTSTPILRALFDIDTSTLSDEEKHKATLQRLRGGPGLTTQAGRQMAEYGDTTKHVAHLSNRLVTIGEAVKGPIERIEKQINNLVEDQMDHVVGALDLVADGVEDLSGFLKKHFGGDIRGSAKKTAKDAEREITDAILGGDSKKLTEIYGGLAKQREEIRGDLDRSSSSLPGVATTFGLEAPSAVFGVASQLAEEARNLILGRDVNSDTTVAERLAEAATDSSATLQAVEGYETLSHAQRRARLGREFVESVPQATRDNMSPEQVNRMLNIMENALDVAKRQNDLSGSANSSRPSTTVPSFQPGGTVY